MEELLSNTQTSFDDISESYERICEDIKKAMAEAGRTDEVRLMAVTKTVSPERINHAISLGVELLGENRVQELTLKQSQDAYATLSAICSAIKSSTLLIRSQ